MAFHLGRLVFRVESATLSASLPDPYWCKTYNKGSESELLWGIHFRMSPAIIDGVRWAPSLDWESRSLPIRQWKDFAGRTISWDRPYDEESGESVGSFYVFEHASVPRACLRMGERQGPEFAVVGNGVCDVFWDQEFGENVPFRLAATMTFTRVRVNGTEFDTAKSLAERLAVHLDLDTLVQQPIQRGAHHYESGVGMVYGDFVPRP
jgi:hypothetical protein